MVEQDDSEIIRRAFENIPTDSKIFVRNLSDIIDNIQKSMKKKNWNESDLSKALNVKEEKVNTWLYGLSNITLRDIAKLESVLETKLIYTHGYIPIVFNTKKFVDTIEVGDWEVETDKGWADIKAIGKTVEYDEWLVKTDRCKLICADDHIVFKDNGEEIFVKNLNFGDKIITKNGIEEVIEVYKTDKKSNMFDLQIDSDDHRYYTNDILSHNSMWLYNIACNSANEGKNVVVITVEMGWRKVMKRLGAMRLKIDVDQYSDLSKDTIFMKNKINALKSTGNGLFNTDSPGKIFVKKFNTGSCTISDIDNYLTKLEEIKNIKIDVVVLDYINLMSVDKTNKDIGNNLYLKGKHLSEGLRYIADKFDLALITATQVDRSVWGANDIKLQDIPESKAVAETADSVWAIIRNTEMKRHNKYRLKILKLRDGDHKEETIVFDFHPQYLVIENDIMEK